jgi:actin, other eukaryote
MESPDINKKTIVNKQKPSIINTNVNINVNKASTVKKIMTDKKPVIDNKIITDKKPIIDKTTTNKIPVINKKITDDVKPSIGKKTTVDVKPSIDKKSTVDVKPSIDKKSTVDVKPTIDKKTTVDVKPSIDKKTTVDVKPTTDKKTTVDVKPSIGKKTTVDVKPTTDKKTTVDVKPTTDKKTTVDVKPSIDKKTTADIKLSLDKKTTGDVKSSLDKKTTADIKSSLDNKTTGDVKPSLDKKLAVDKKITIDDETVDGNEISTDKKSITITKIPTTDKKPVTTQTSTMDKKPIATKTPTTDKKPVTTKTPTSDKKPVTTKTPTTADETPVINKKLVTTNKTSSTNDKRQVTTKTSVISDKKPTATDKTSIANDKKQVTTKTSVSSDKNPIRHDLGAIKESDDHDDDDKVDDNVNGKEDENDNEHDDDNDDDDDDDDDEDDDEDDGNVDSNSLDTIVIDNGSGMVKAGFAGEENPRCVFPSIIGKPKYKNMMKYATSVSAQTSDKNNIYVGDDAREKRGILKISYPIEHGIVTNWDDMEKIWQHTFETQLRVDPTGKKVLLTEAPQNPRQNREKMIEIMFEKFNVGASYVAVQGVLSLYASGRTTGIVLDIGDGVTHTIPVYQGFCIPHAITRYDLAGRDVTDYMKTLLQSKGHNLYTSSEREIVKDIKDKYCYCAQNYDEEIKLFETKNMTKPYSLPDGSQIMIGDEMFKSAEVLFNPDLIGKEIKGIDFAVHDSIQRTPIDVRKDLYSNIVLSGGTTMIKNLDKRLEKELNFLKTGRLNVVKIIAPAERKYSVWIGGSILSSLESFNNAWITKYEYDECGSQIIHDRSM